MTNETLKLTKKLTSFDLALEALKLYVDNITPEGCPNPDGDCLVCKRNKLYKENAQKALKVLALIKEGL